LRASGARAWAAVDFDAYLLWDAATGMRSSHALDINGLGKYHTLVITAGHRLENHLPEFIPPSPPFPLPRELAQQNATAPPIPPTRFADNFDIFDSSETIDLTLSRQVQQQVARSMLYERLVYTGSAPLFADLPSHAPGLNTSRADVQAALEAEATPELRNTPG